jgi:hypothetical protein
VNDSKREECEDEGLFIPLIVFSGLYPPRLQVSFILESREGVMVHKINVF